MNQSTTPNLLDQVTDVCVEVLRVPRQDVVGPARLVEDLNVDSLFVIQLAMGLEDRFGLQIPEEDLPSFKTIDDMVDYIQSKLEAR